MNAPSSAAFIKYSGQWVFRDARAPSLGGEEDGATRDGAMIVRFDASAIRLCSMLFMQSGGVIRILPGSDSEKRLGAGAGADESPALQRHVSCSKISQVSGLEVVGVPALYGPQIHRSGKIKMALARSDLRVSSR